MFRGFILLALLFTISCNRCNTATEQKDVTSIDSSASDKDTAEVQDLPWVTAINPKTGETHLQHLPGKGIRMTPQQIVRIANRKYPQIQLQWLRKEGNTAYLTIPEAGYLTQSMGSAGAEAYLSEITFSLTELEGITAVDLRFTEGDHASPGVYTRKQFSDLTAD